MVKIGKGEDSPTMIIPSGTEIDVDVHGQLSVRTPGNLVIQNSGNYATLESLGGSIRIESNAEVEAVTVRAAETCFVEGSLTAWKVAAKSIHLEESAKANIVLQEADRLEIGQDARLVGNFGSEKELFFLFSRFAGELRSLPLFAERRKKAELEGEETPEFLLTHGAKDSSVELEAEIRAESAVENESAGAPPAVDAEGLDDRLFYSLVILEREFTRPVYGPSSRRVLEELIKLLRERDLDTLRLTYRTLFGRIVEPGKDVQRVFELIQAFFKA